jgi:hypothetical protein
MGVKFLFLKKSRDSSYSSEVKALPMPMVGVTKKRNSINQVL